MVAERLLAFVPFILLVLFGVLAWKAFRQNARSNGLVPVTAGLPARQYAGPLAFFQRHYNGDYSLARSYWVNTLLVTLFAPVIGILLLPWLNAHFPARYGSAAFLLITVLGIAAWCWAVSGTWASANKHVQRGGRQGWAVAAKVMIVLGAFKTFGDLGMLTPALQEHARVAMGAQLGPSTRLEVRSDGRSILVSGGINDYSAEQLDKALRIAPAVTTVVFSSEGGWVREGLLLADVVRKHGLNTYVEDSCSSACTIAFLAGRDRAAAPSAKIGFHSGRSVGSMDSSSSADSASHIASVYRDRGLPEAFIRQAMRTPNEKMWYPSHEEMLIAGVLTRKSLGGETAAMSTLLRSKQTLVDEFKKLEAFALLAERSPEVFDGLVEAAWAKLQSGATDAEVTGAARAKLSEVLPRFLPLASDETLVAYQSLMQEQLEVLRKRDASACVEMVFPSGQAMTVAGNLPPELQKRELSLMARMLREADSGRRIKPSQSGVERVVGLATAGMTQDQIAVFSEEEVRRRSSPIVVCNAIVAFMAGLNAIPATERGRALRVLYAAN